MKLKGKYMKKFLFGLICILLAFSILSIPAFASEISSVDVEGPSVRVVISDIDKDFDVNKVSATLDGKELENKEAEFAGESVEWIVFVDTSISVSAAHFEGSKEAIVDIYNNLGENDKLTLYTFDVGMVSVLNGMETKENAIKKIKGIKAEGRDTEFYRAITKLAYLAKNSKSDSAVPIMFTDGVETLHKEDKAKTLKTLEEYNVPIYGLYPDVLDEENLKEYTSVIKASTGSIKSYSTKSVSSRLASLGGSRAVTLYLRAKETVEESQNAKISINIGGGQILTCNVAVSEWIVDADPPRILSVDPDRNENTITVKFSEPVLGALNEYNYKFLCSEGSAPTIFSIRNPIPDTVVIYVSSLEKGGITVTIENITDLAKTPIETETFKVTGTAQKIDLVPIFAPAVLVLVVGLFLLSLSKMSANKKKKEAAHKAAKEAARRRQAERKGIILTPIETDEEKKAREKQEKKEEKKAKRKEKREEKRKKKKEEELRVQFYFEDKEEEELF